MTPVINTQRIHPLNVKVMRLGHSIDRMVAKLTVELIDSGQIHNEFRHESEGVVNSSRERLDDSAFRATIQLFCIVYRSVISVMTVTVNRNNTGIPLLN